MDPDLTDDLTAQSATAAISQIDAMIVLNFWALERREPKAKGSCW